MQAEEIARMIRSGLPTASIDVRSDDGTHFEATVVADEFARLGTLQRHQMVYGCLGEFMGREIHALSIRAYSPEEWAEVGSG